MANLLVSAEMRDGALRGVARQVTSEASRLAERLGGGKVDVLLLGGRGETAEAAAELGRFGADRVFTAEGETLSMYQPEAAVDALVRLAAATPYDAILFPASAMGKDLAPRVAVRLDRGLATDVTAIEVGEGQLVATRPRYAGKALARMEFSQAPALLSLRPNVFPAEERGGTCSVEPLALEPVPPRTRVQEIEHGDGGRLDVSEADVIVSGGRGLREPGNWRVLEDLVDSLGAGTALGASRAVVDAGWRPHSEQVGQTGKVVSPALYFAVGISGAIQHLAGMRTAGVIVAINQDPEAPIFQVADYGVVGDLFEIVPRLAEEIRRLKDSQA